MEYRFSAAGMNAAGLGEFSEESDPITLGGWVHTQNIDQLNVISLFLCSFSFFPLGDTFPTFGIQKMVCFSFVVVIVVIVVHMSTNCSLFTEYLIYYIIAGAVGGTFLITLLICCVGIVICCRRKHSGQLGKYKWPSPRKLLLSDSIPCLAQQWFSISSQSWHPSANLRGL